jgi:hypothetical protein
VRHTLPLPFRRSLALALALLVALTGAPSASAQPEADVPPSSQVHTPSAESLEAAIAAYYAAKDKGPKASALVKVDSALRRAIEVRPADPAGALTLLGAGVQGDAVQVEVLVDVERAARADEALRGAGARVTGTGDGGARVQAWVPLGALEALAGEEAILQIRRPQAFEVYDTPSAGVRDSEGLAAMLAAAWHAAGYRGAGARVGVIDGGFRGYAALLGTELPAQVTVRNFKDGESDGSISVTGSEHGTACAEIIHDVAPDATLFLAKISTPIDFEEAVAWLIAQHVDVISMSGGWSGTTPGDGTGYQASIVQQAHDAGILWVNAAGNERLTHWGGPFRDLDGDHWHEFDGSGIEFNHLTWADGTPAVLGAGYQLRAALRWNDWSLPTQDFDLYLMRDDGDVTVVAASDDYQTGVAGQRPTEYVAATTSGGDAVYGLVIRRFNSSREVNLDLFVPDAPRLYASVAARSLCSPADAAAAMAIAAVHSASPYPQEIYSSEGPTNGPGGAAGGGLDKPALAAYANVATASYGPCSGTYCFNGTSAATPHVAGAAALVAGALPSLSPDVLRHYLQSRAVDIGAAGFDTQTGYGRLSLGAPPVLRRVAVPLIRRGPRPASPGAPGAP